MKKQFIKLSLSGFLFETEKGKQSISFAEFCELANANGYNGVELRKTQITPDTPPNTIKQYRIILNDNGLSVTCITPRGIPSGNGNARNDFFKRYLDLANSMECKLMKIAGANVNDHDWLRNAVQEASGRGIDLAINTHINSPTETVAGALNLTKKINSPHFGILYDCMHLCIADEDYLGAIDKLYPTIRGILVQCLCPAEKGENPTIIHKGKKYAKCRIDQNPIQDWPSIISKLKSLNYNGWITVIENSWPQNQQKKVAINTAKYISELWKT